MSAHERTPEPTKSRNGDRGRLWQTRADAVELKIPKRRQGSDVPAFLEPRRTAETALAAVIQQAYSSGHRFGLGALAVGH